MYVAYYVSQPTAIQREAVSELRYTDIMHYKTILQLKRDKRVTIYRSLTLNVYSALHIECVIQLYVFSES